MSGETIRRAAVHRAAFRGWLRGAGVFLLVLAGARALGAAGPSSAAMAAGTMWTLVFAILGFLACSALVSSSETALFSLDKLDLSQMKNSHRLSDKAILQLHEHPNNTLAAILVLNNLCNIAISLTTAAFMNTLFGQASALAFTLAALVATACILIFGEILPKVVAHHFRQRAARLLAPPLAFFAWLVIPFRWVLRALRIPEPAATGISDEELKAMINSGEVSSVLEEDEREMIEGVFDLRHSVAREILTPRMSLVALPDDLTQEELAARLRQIPHNRVPIYHENPDNLVGFLLAKEVLLDAQGDWRKHLREVLCVPEGVGLLDLLKTFRRKRTKMAIVVDEYGGVSGMVTLQDLLEEIVGDIYEKHEPQEMGIQPLGPDAWRVSGMLDLERLGEKLGIEFPEHRGRTSGGFVMNTLGRIPELGAEATYEPLTFKVEKMSGRRVTSLLVTRSAPKAADPAQEETTP